MNNTFFNNGIEFVLPGIYKASPLCWSNDFINNGTIYFTNIINFIKDEDNERGDKKEGIGVSNINGKKYSSDYMNPLYVWCSTMETNTNFIFNTWKDRDSIILITDTLGFLNRIKTTILESKYKKSLIGLQVGPVTYNKDEGSQRNYHWAEGIFQKNYKYNTQKEFRLALTGTSELKEEHLVFELGSCKDITKIIHNQ